MTTQKRHQNFDYTTIADRLSTVSWSNNSHPAVVVKPVYGIPTFPLTATRTRDKVSIIIVQFGIYTLCTGYKVRFSAFCFIFLCIPVSCFALLNDDVILVRFLVGTIPQDVRQNNWNKNIFCECIDENCLYDIATLVNLVKTHTHLLNL